MVLWREVSKVRALEARPQVLGPGLLAPGLEYGVSKSEAKWLGLLTRGLGDEPEALLSAGGQSYRTNAKCLGKD